MADIHVQPEKKPTTPGTTWVWILVAILILAALAYFVFMRQEPAQTAAPEAAPSVWIHAIPGIVTGQVSQ